jgi:hypothetical protein
VCPGEEVVAARVQRNVEGTKGRCSTNNNEGKELEVWNGLRSKFDVDGRCKEAEAETKGKGRARAKEKTPAKELASGANTTATTPIIPRGLNARYISHPGSLDGTTAPIGNLYYCYYYYYYCYGLQAPLLPQNPPVP